MDCVQWRQPRAGWHFSLHWWICPSVYPQQGPWLHCTYTRVKPETTDSVKNKHKPVTISEVPLHTLLFTMRVKTCSTRALTWEFVSCRCSCSVSKKRSRSALPESSSPSPQRTRTRISPSTSHTATRIVWLWRIGEQDKIAMPFHGVSESESLYADRIEFPRKVNKAKQLHVYISNTLAKCGNTFFVHECYFNLPSDYQRENS